MSDKNTVRKDKRVVMKEIKKKHICYDCGGRFLKVHKVTLNKKVRYYCEECYSDLIERLRKEKQTS